jgi:hypothetical protein
MQTAGSLAVLPGALMLPPGDCGSAYLRRCVPTSLKTNIGFCIVIGLRAGAGGFLPPRGWIRAAVQVQYLENAHAVKQGVPVMRSARPFAWRDWQESSAAQSVATDTAAGIGPTR